MSKKTTRAAISAVIVLTALISVMYTTVSEGARYYKHVDEVMNEPTQWYGKTMNLHGFVVDKSIEQRRDTLDYRFKVRSGDHSVLATYSGVVPDPVKDGAEGVMTGELGPDGFKAPELTAKGPSTDEAAGPGAPVTR